MSNDPITLTPHPALQESKKRARKTDTGTVDNDKTPVVIFADDSDGWTPIFFNLSGCISSELWRWCRLCCTAKDIHQEQISMLLMIFFTKSLPAPGSETTNNGPFRLDEHVDAYPRGVRLLERKGINDESIARIIDVDIANWKHYTLGDYNSYLVKNKYPSVKAIFICGGFV